MTFLLCVATSSILGQRQKNILLYSDAIYFSSGASKVAPKYTKELKKVVEAIKSHPEASAWIQAHTDSLGGYLANEALSERRSNAVLAILKKEGVAEDKLKIDSHGEYVPVQSNGTAAGRAKNRRVTIQVVRPYVPRSKDENKCIVRGTVTNAQTGDPLSATIFIATRNGEKDSVETNEEGIYEYTRYTNTTVEITAYSKGYFFVTKKSATIPKKTVELDFKLEPAIIGGKMALNDLYFYGGTPILLPESEKALVGVVDFMQFNADLRIEIGGHINKPNQAPVPTSSKSFQLSENRARVVYEYLIEKGIAKERLSFKGYGNAEMLFPRASNPVEEQTNRRVELKVVE